MKLYYDVAGLTIAMETYGRTLKQAAAYLTNFTDNADIEIHSTWPEVKHKYPHLSDDDGEYLASGANFYKQLLDYDGLMLHASAVVVDGKAYLFTADSGTGKSTHTRLWLNRFGERAFILNDDKPALRLQDGIWYAYGTPWSGKHDISVNAGVPVAGIAILERGHSNEICKADGLFAVCAIMKQVNRPHATVYREKLLRLADKLITGTPIWRLKCNIDPDAVDVSYKAMSGL